MTLDEAKTIAWIIGQADGGCSVCVGNLIDLMNEKFSGFVFFDEGEADDDIVTRREVSVQVNANAAD